MERGRPEGTPGEPARLEAERGHLRDALGSVRNLAQVLHSVRVGPRSIESVLPDVRDSCAAIDSHAKTLLDSVAARLPDDAAPDELLAWMLPRTRELECELGAALGKPVNAKARLRLEQVVTRVSRELEAGRALVDLLDEAVRGARVQLDLAELLRHAHVSRDDGDRIEVRVAPDLVGEVSLNARVCSLVLGVGASLLRERGTSAPLVRLGTGRSLTLAADDAAGEVVSLPTLPLVAPTLTCAETAARACGARLDWDSSVPRFTLHLPA